MIQKNEEKFHSLYAVMHEAVFFGEIVRDSSGKSIDYIITDANPAFELVTRHYVDKILGKKASELYKTPPFLHTYVKAVTSGKSSTFEVYSRVMKRYFRVSALPISKDKFASVWTDITEHKNLEAQLLDYQKELRALASELFLAEERERRRIATEMHDRVSQTLALCRIKLSELIQSGSSANLADDLAEIHIIVKKLIDEVRSLTFEMSSPLLYELGLGAALEYLTEQIQKQHHLQIIFKDDGQAKPIDENISILLFQTVRELLINIVKHANAHQARVSLNKSDDNLHIVVEDDGIGFDAPAICTKQQKNKGFGLFCIRERLRYISGHMEIESQLGRGTKVKIIVPLTHASSHHEVKAL
jgi:signal transduction histidine kinase